eukprot:TRINITY_DN350_c0_g1_i2.p1 TRINITY_DN350_c0_g1~~TRINITY_DN350_c0_g1_i2.p1  ORF type:complete len:342 (-),score=73.30 TRINITY_DN350_c0_g1_i2:109-1134(-)
MFVNSVRVGKSLSRGVDFPNIICSREKMDIIYAKTKTSVKKFPFVYGWYHLIVFQSAKDAKKGTSVVNSKRPSRFGLLTPEEVLPEGQWMEGIPLTLRKQLHRLIPIGIPRESEKYIDSKDSNDEEMLQTPIRPDITMAPRRRAIEKRRRPNHFQFSVKMEDVNSNPIIQMNTVNPFRHYQPVAPSGMKFEENNGPRIKQEPKGFVTPTTSLMSPSGPLSAPDSGFFNEFRAFLDPNTSSTTTFSFSPSNKSPRTSVALPAPMYSLASTRVKSEMAGPVFNFYSGPATQTSSKTESHAKLPPQVPEPLSKRRRCGVGEIHTDAMVHDFTVKNVVVTPHANS